jgi:UDP-N-acetylglucosamine---dolichyl-phosphate N-acetylglucosaminyltransferase
MVAGIAPRIVVIDDGSSDGTPDAVLRCGDARVTLLRHDINRGAGAALATGIAYARAEGGTTLVTYDADGQHAPEDIEKVVLPIISGEAEFVAGSRLKNPAGMPWYRLIGNWGLNLFTWFFFGIWTTDSQSGLRALGPRALSGIQLQMDRMEVSSEFFKEIRRLKLRYSEVAIRAIFSEYSLAKGQSNWNAFNILLRLLYHRLMED